MGVVLALLLLGGGLGACSTARQREEPSNILGALRFRNAEAEAHFRESHRSGNLYHDFRPVLIVDAIFKDARFREILLDTLRQRYLLDESQYAKMMAEQQKEFDTDFEFIVLIYGGSNRPVRLDRESSNWKIYLRDDDGDLLHPASIRHIPVDSATYTFLQRHFDGLDRWSEPFVVRFPKLAKPLIGEKPGSHPVELIVSGVEGTVTMRWDDPGLFFRRPGTPGPPPPSDGDGAAPRTP